MDGLKTSGRKRLIWPVGSPDAYWTPQIKSCVSQWSSG